MTAFARGNRPHCATFPAIGEPDALQRKYVSTEHDLVTRFDRPRISQEESIGVAKVSAQSSIGGISVAKLPVELLETIPQVSINADPIRARALAEQEYSRSQYQPREQSDKKPNSKQ